MDIRPGQFPPEPPLHWAVDWVLSKNSRMKNPLKASAALRLSRSRFKDLLRGDRIVASAMIGQSTNLTRDPSRIVLEARFLVIFTNAERILIILGSQGRRPTTWVFDKAVQHPIQLLLLHKIDKILPSFRAWIKPNVEANVS